MIDPLKLPKIWSLLENFKSALRRDFEIRNFLRDYIIQCNYNIPILLLTALHIGKHCNDHKLRRVLFSSRDCFYLVKIFDALFNNSIESKYFYTSRIARIHPTETYKAYCSSLINDQTLVVDLCGTGNSLGSLYKSLQIQPKTFFLHLIKQNNQENSNISHLINGSIFNNIYIEMANYSTNGMFLNMECSSLDNTFNPIFKDPKFPKKLVTRIHNFNNLFGLFLEELKLLDAIDLIIEQRDNSYYVVETIKALYKKLTMQEDDFSDFFYYHFKDAKEVENLLHKKV